MTSSMVCDYIFTFMIESLIIRVPSFTTRCNPSKRFGNGISSGCQFKSCKMMETSYLQFSAFVFEYVFANFLPVMKISLCISICIILLFVCVLVCVCLPASLKAGKWWQTGPTSLQGHSIEMPLKSALCWHILSAVLLNWQLELFGVGFYLQEFGWFAQILFTIRWNSIRFTNIFFKLGIRS